MIFQQHSSSHPSTTPLTLLVLLTLLLSPSVVLNVQARLSCTSPSGSFHVGDATTFGWSDNGVWPRGSDVDSCTAVVRCTSGAKQILQVPSVMDGQPWIVPQEAIAAACPGNSVTVEYTCKVWDVLHLSNIIERVMTCSSFVVAPSIVPTTVAPTTTVPTTPPISMLPITTPITTSSTLNTTLIPTTTATRTSPLDSGSTTGRTSHSPSPGDETRVTNSRTNVPSVVLGTLGSLAFVGLVVFVVVMTRRRKRLAQEKQWLTEESLRKGGFGSGEGSLASGWVGYSGGSHGTPERGSWEQLPLPGSSLPRPMEYANPMVNGGFGMGFDYEHGYGYNSNSIGNGNHFGQPQDRYPPQQPPPEMTAVATAQPTDREYYDHIHSVELPMLPLPPTITSPDPYGTRYGSRRWTTAPEP
ncbi:MAG: hypothetical protein J3Q66DRAFT_332422 [Benniella sp.]|nr:MAG: hypothetical protein J3Q66DRAFT_332422 [Benniella sp.]